MFNSASTKKPEPRRAAATQSQYSWQIRLRLSGQRVLPHCPCACLLRIGLHELQQSGYIFFLRTESLRQLLFVSWKGVTFYLILFWILVFSWSGHPKSEDYATTRALLANLQLHLPCSFIPSSHVQRIRSHRTIAKFSVQAPLRNSWQAHISSRRTTMHAIIILTWGVNLGVIDLFFQNFSNKCIVHADSQSHRTSTKFMRQRVSVRTSKRNLPCVNIGAHVVQIRLRSAIMHMWWCNMWTEHFEDEFFSAGMLGFTIRVSSYARSWRTAYVP